MADATESLNELTPEKSKESNVPKTDKKPAVKKVTKPAKKTAAKVAKKTAAKVAKPAKAKVAKAAKAPSDGHKAQTQVDAKAWKLIGQKTKAGGFENPAEYLRDLIYSRLKYKPAE